MKRIDQRQFSMRDSYFDKLTAMAKHYDLSNSEFVRTMIVEKWSQYIKNKNNNNQI